MNITLTAAEYERLTIVLNWYEDDRRAAAQRAAEEGTGLYDAGEQESLEAADEARDLLAKLRSTPAPRPVHTHKDCGGTVLYDAWADSNDEIVSSFDNAFCDKCEREVSRSEIDWNESTTS